MRTLGRIIEQASHLQAVYREDLQFGDCLLVTTAHSIYRLYVLKDGDYLISGGWFDHSGQSPMKTTVAGCTWGGSAIKIDMIAACGLHLEFGNKVVTSPICGIDIIRCETRYVN
jgi:hypothetical protein